jgi:hypothetical protein
MTTAIKTQLAALLKKRRAESGKPRKTACFIRFRLSAFDGDN